MSGIKIRGTGRFAPAKIVTNDDLAKIVDTSDEWITTRTGIQTRHHCTTETHTDMCVGAARQALENAGISPEDIGACVVATFSSDYLSPSAACMVQRGLGLPHDAVCFDLNAACSGFLFAIHTMECLLAQAPRKYGLVIGAEMLSRFINWEDRGTCVLFGDGAGAVVVEWREDYPSIHAVLGCHGDPDMLGVTGAEKPAPARIFMHGQPTFKFAVKAVPYCIDQVLEKAVMAIEDVDFFVFHQANARIIDLAAKKYHIPRRSTTRTSRNTATPPPPASPWSSVSSMTWERWGPAPGSWWWASAAASPGAAPWWSSPDSLHVKQALWTQACYRRKLQLYLGRAQRRMGDFYEKAQ